MSLHKVFVDTSGTARFYPERPTPAQRDDIRGLLIRQWGCIEREWACKAAGQPWDVRDSFDPERLPEAILAILEGPLAWRRIPLMVAAFYDLGPFQDWVDVWANRADGVIYVTLSPEGAQKLRVRPSGLWNTDRGKAIEAGETDALWAALTGDTAYMPIDEDNISGWLPVVYPLNGNETGGDIPLSSWSPDRDSMEWHVHQQFESMDAIGWDAIPDPNCESEREKVFTREARRDEWVREQLRQAAS